MTITIFGSFADSLVTAGCVTTALDIDDFAEAGVDGVVDCASLRRDCVAVVEAAEASAAIARVGVTAAIATATINTNRYIRDIAIPRGMASAGCAAMN
jgi:hypothetical protein